MVESRKRKPKKRDLAQIDSKPLSAAEKEEQQHKNNSANAYSFIKQVMDLFVTTGVGKSLLTILDTVRHWPSEIDKADSQAFVPPFNATEISAEEVQENDDTITRVSFSYAGEKYDLVTRIKNVDSEVQTPGSLELQENGKWAIRMDIVKMQGHDQFMYRALNAFRYDSWIENMVRIESEIEKHRQCVTNESD